MPYNKRQNNTRKLISKSKIKSTRKNNSKYSEGFIRRMSEPVRLVPIKLSNEELARINKKMPLTLSTDQQEELFIKMNS
jgi:hypothetical protein